MLTILPLPIVNTYRGWTVCLEMEKAPSSCFESLPRESKVFRPYSDPKCSYKGIGQPFEVPPPFSFPFGDSNSNLLVRRFVATRVACPTSRAISSPDIFLPLRAHLRRPMNSPAPPSTLDRDGFESDGPDQSHSQARRGLRGPARPGPQGSCERVH